MKKLFIYTFLCFGSMVKLFSFQALDGQLLKRGDSFGITIEPSFGYLYGQSREIVYADDSNIDTTSTKGEGSFNGYYLSELIWDLANVLYAGASGSANIRNRYYINAGLWTAITPGTGYMNDYDWIYWNSKQSRPYYLHDRNGLKDISHWSLSTVNIVSSFLGDINFSYDFLSRRQWNLSGIAGFRYLYWSWTDEIIDSEYDGVEDYLTTGVNAIDYQLELDIPYFGIGSFWNPESGFLVGVRLIYSPFLIGRDHDHHKERTDYSSTDGLHFYDAIHFGQFFSGSIRIGYDFSSHFRMIARIDGDYLIEKKGNSAIYATPGGTLDYIGTSINSIGIQYQAISFTLNAAFSF